MTVWIKTNMWPILKWSLPITLIGPVILKFVSKWSNFNQDFSSLPTPLISFTAKMPVPWVQVGTPTWSWWARRWPTPCRWWGTWGGPCPRGTWPCGGPQGQPGPRWTWGTPAQDMDKKDEGEWHGCHYVAPVNAITFLCPPEGFGGKPLDRSLQILHSVMSEQCSFKHILMKGDLRTILCYKTVTSFVNLDGEFEIWDSQTKAIFNKLWLNSFSKSWIMKVSEDEFESHVTDPRWTLGLSHTL